MDHKQTKAKLFQALTWNDLAEWAGETMITRGKDYQRNHKVTKLAHTPDGGLIAWVTGAEQYATQVDIEADGTLSSNCTCPYHSTCKHAVAVVLDYLEQTKKFYEIPTVAKDDRRLSQLDTSSSENSVSVNQGQPAQTQSISLRHYLEGQTKEQLVQLLEELAVRYTQVHEVLQDKSNFASGAVEKIVAVIRSDIDALEQEYSEWDGDWDEGSEVDLGQLQERLENLLAQGAADQIIELGEELLVAGTRQNEMDHEGESTEEIASCIKVVFQALPQSSLSTVEQILWVLDRELEDEYDLCYAGSQVFWKQEHSAAAWSQVADALMKRVERPLSKSQQENFSYKYQRDKIIDWIIKALTKSDRQTEIIPLCQNQVEQTNNGYTRLVNQLRKAERLEEAEHWIHQGIAATQQEAPGIANQLRDIFQELQEQAHNWDQVAALTADQFFNSPSLQTFQVLQKAAKRIGVLPTVRTAALHYLETGKSPLQDQGIEWPLPKPIVTLASPRYSTHFPDTHTLLDIAIAEQQVEEIIRWYTQRDTQSFRGGWGSHLDNRVAEAIVAAYPDKAIAIWKKIAEELIATTKPKAYQEAAPYLRKVNQVLKKLNRESEWHSYIKDLRQQHARKRRLLEVLDSLSGKRIID